MVPDVTKTFYSTNTWGPLLDDAVTRSSIYVATNQKVLSVQAGVRLDHQRASDLALTLTSPQGTRVLLFEDRGQTSSSGLESA